MSSELTSSPQPDNENGAKTANKKLQFTSTLTMSITLLGFSFGTADIWRFPFLVYRNGGGAFLLPYLITVAFCGIPLYLLEYGISNFSGKGPFEIWDISPVFRGVGISVAVAYFIWMVGSSVFRSWLVIFLLDSLGNPLPWTHCNNPWNTPTCRDNPFVKGVVVDNSTFNNSATTAMYLPPNNTSGMTATEEYWTFKALNLSTGITDFTPILWKHILSMLVLRVLVFLSLVKSIKSIEKVMYVLLFAPIVYSVVVMVQSAMLPGSKNGAYEFFYPDITKLRNPRIWIEASLMAFYSIGFGWGAIISMGSHGHFKDNCVRTSIVLPFLDCLNGIINGVVCFMVLGNLAHAYNVKIYDVINAGLSTGVVSYISALSVLPAPQFWNFTFIIMAILSGLDTQIVPIEMCLQVLGEMFPGLYPKYRLHTLAAISILLFVLALPTCTGAGGYIFLWLDWYTGVWIGPICAFVELIAVGWVYGMDRFSMDISLMTGKPAPWFFRVFLVFVTPSIVLAVFVTSCVEYVPPNYGSYNYPYWARGIGWLLVACILSPIVINALVVVQKYSGSICLRIKRGSKATPRWGPKDENAKKEFRSRRNRNLPVNRTLKDMLYYVIFGTYRNGPDVVPRSELSVFVDK